MDKDINTSTVFLAIKNNLRQMIAINCFVVGLSLVYLLFFYPPIFASSVTLVHFGNNMKQSQGSGLISSLGLSVPSISSTGASTAPAEVVIQILKSNTLANKVLSQSFYSENFQKEIPLFKIFLNDETIDDNNKFIYEAKKFFKDEVLVVEKNRMTNVINLTVTTNEARLSYNVALSVVNFLNESYNDIERKKAMQKEKFINERLVVNNQKLINIEKEYIDFKDQNKSVQSPLLILKERALQRDVEMHTMMVSTLKQELEMTKLDLYDEMNEILIINEPEILPYRSNRRLFVLLFCVGMGLFLSALYVMSKIAFNNNNLTTNQSYE